MSLINSLLFGYSGVYRKSVDHALKLFILMLLARLVFDSIPSIVKNPTPFGFTLTGIWLLKAIAFMLILSVKRTGVYLWGISFLVISAIVISKHDSTGWDFTAYIMALLLLANGLLAWLLCKKKDGKSAWQVLFEKQKK